jgi:hypothetical protein
MKKFIYTILAASIVIFSCMDEEDIFDYPENDGLGDYIYESHSTYNSLSIENKEVESQGYLRSTLNTTTYEFLVMPNVGWSYTIYGENVVEETLSDGEIVYVFMINAFRQTINGEEYRIVGTVNVALLDSDGSFLKYVDGYMKGDKIVYEFMSMKVNGSEQTITYTESQRRI